MAINPVNSTIALSGTSPSDTLADLAKADSYRADTVLKQAQTQHALQQAAEQKSIADQKTADLNDQNALQKHFGDNPDAMRGFFAAGGDLTKAAQYLPAGVQPKTIQGLSQSAAKLAQEYQTTRSLKAKNDSEALVEVSKSLQSIYERGQQDPSTIGTNYQSALANNPHLKDLPFAIPPKMSSLDELKDAITTVAGFSGFAQHALDQQKEQAGIAETRAKTTGELAKVDETKAKTDETRLKATQAARQQYATQLASIAESSPGALGAAVAALPAEHQDSFKGLTKADQIRRVGMTPEQVVQADREAADLERRRQSDAETKRYHTGELGARATEIGIQRQRFNLEQQRAGFDMNGGISPAARAIADGTFDAETARATLRKNPGLISQIKALDPEFDQNNLDKRGQVLKEFTSSAAGKAGGQVIAFNTAIHHADLYLQAQEALKNGSFQPGNTVYNKFVDTFGSANVNDSKIVARALAGEINKATSGVQAEGEMKGTLDTLSSSASPEKAAGAVKTMIGLMAGKLSALNEKVVDAKLSKVVHVLGDDAKEILSKRGFDPETMKPAGGPVKWTDPNGGVHDFPSKAQLDKFKKDHGVQ